MVGVAVDVLHGASMAGLAVLDPMRRMAASTSAVDAGAWAAFGALSDVYKRQNLERGPSGRSRLALHLDLRKGDHRDLVLELSSDGVALPSKIDAEHYWQSTEAAWHEAVPSCSGVVASRDVRRSVAVLLSLIHI